MEMWPMCRLCLESREEELKSILDSSFEEVSYYDIFFTIVGTNLMDYNAIVPMKLCSQCEDELLKAYEFRRKCLNTEERLRGWKKTKNKAIEFVSTLEEEEEEEQDSEQPDVDKTQSVENLDTEEEEPEYLQEEVVVDEVTKNENNLRIRCKSCKAFFDGMDIFKSHICGRQKIEMLSEGESRNEPFFKCTKCSKTFIGRSYFMAHLDQHAERKIRHKCSHCNMEFHSLATRQSHIHREHLKTYSCHCPFCGKGFYDKNRRTNHIRDKHTNPSVFQCDRCGKELNSSISLNSHMKQHTDEVTCEICGRKLKNQRTFEHHMALHTSEKRFTCLECSNTFRTNPQLRKHMRNVHGNQMITVFMSTTGESTADVKLI